MRDCLFGVTKKSICLAESDFEQRDCSSAQDWTCPAPCQCHEGIVDCRNKKLDQVPDRFPADTTEM